MVIYLIRRLLKTTKTYPSSLEYVVNCHKITISKARYQVYNAKCKISNVSCLFLLRLPLSFTQTNFDFPFIQILMISLMTKTYPDGDHAPPSLFNDFIVQEEQKGER